LQTERERQFLAAEHQVELHSAHLKKELRLGDLVAIQILNIVGLAWIGIAAKLGPSHLMFWLSAMLLFYIPSGIVVAHLSTEMPLEGGIYQWAKLRYGPLVGFLAAMNIWLNCVTLISKIGIQSAGSISYAIGSGGEWLAGSKIAITGLTIVIIFGLTLVSVRGLSLGKWINNIGGMGVVFLFAAVIVVAIPRWFHADVAIAPVSFAFPALSLLNLNLLGKMGMGAFSGCDGVAIFAGECKDRDPGAMLSRSVWIAGPLISGIFILGTASVLTFNKPENVDVMLPIMQVLSLGAPSLKALASLLLVVTLLTGCSLSFSMTARLPMVAGWDHLLPAWYSKLHPRFRTPTGSILVVAAASFLFGMMANLSGGNQEAYQLLDNASGMFFALPYMIMFSIPLLAPGEKPSLRVRVAGVSGFMMALLYVLLSVIPVIDVSSSLGFTLKMIGVVLGFQIAGVAYFVTRRRKLLAQSSQ